MRTQHQTCQNTETSGKRNEKQNNSTNLSNPYKGMPKARFRRNRSTYSISFQGLFYLATVSTRLN
ncbi:MAG: hypothetical protein P9X24_02935 [Candidatus Hatepunaea meridiana]|nr:hypothetical protein [Candidatus Hatepunaea meridiana]